ncbi:MAG TPA: DUF5685 family protein [Polyangiaceae bacterium]|nr:DUF5685 family protein [Polyangiaceae bacterium]
MFGTLKPQRCRLPLVERQAHERLYCGLCQSLGEGYGTAVRGLLSHDAVFLALLAEGLQGEPAAHASCRCPLVPIVHRPTLSPESPAMRYAAAYQLLLADQFLADRQADGRRLFGAARALLARHVARARRGLVGLGLDPSPLEGFESRQLACERRARVEATDAARPTAEALSIVLAHAADLPGADPRAAGPETRAELGALGFALGAIIYLQDALEDLRNAALAGAFNPCLGPGAGGRPAPDRRRVERACRALDDALGRARHSLRALPLRRHRALLESVLEGELGRRARAAMQSARAWASEAGREHLALRADPNPFRVARERWLFALAWLTSWFAMVASAFAQTKAGSGPRRLPRAPHAPGPAGHGGSAGAAGQAGYGGAGSAGHAGDGAGSGGHAGDAGQGAGGFHGRDDAGWFDAAGQAGSAGSAGGAGGSPDLGGTGGAAGAAPHGHDGRGFDVCHCLSRQGGAPSPGAAGSASPHAPPVPNGGGFDAPAPPGPAPGGGSSPSGGGSDPCPSCGDPCQSCGDTCRGCCNPCGGCDKACKDCSDTCTEPCRGCGNCCKGCDGSCCNSCTDPCQGCCSGGGNCCNGCNNCGNCRGCGNAPPDPSNLSDCCDKGPWA